MGGPFERAFGVLGERVGLSKGIAFVEVQRLGKKMGEDEAVHFYPDGRADEAFIRLRCADGEERTVRIEALFGRTGVGGG